MRFEHSDWFVKAEGSAEDLSGKVGTNTFAAVNVHRPRTASATGKCVTYPVRCVAGVHVWVCPVVSTAALISLIPPFSWLPHGSFFVMYRCMLVILQEHFLALAAEDLYACIFAGLVFQKRTSFCKVQGSNDLCKS